MKNVAIIGAGASGLFLARLLADVKNLNVFVFERCKNVGIKLRASGGGKANIFNVNVLPEHYNQSDFIDELLMQIKPSQLQGEFERLGLQVIVDEEGRVYPCTEYSQTVVDVLRQPLADNVRWQMEYEVTRLFRADDGWHVNDFPTIFDAVVIASGSPANMIPKNRVGYNGFLAELKLKSKPLSPSLVGFKIVDYPKSLSGCRVKVKAALYQQQHLIHEEYGEVTFKDDGLSGIVIMNLSAHYNRLSNKRNCWLSLDLLPRHPDFDMNQHIRRFHSLQGVLHPKLLQLFENKPFDVHNFIMEIQDTYDLTSAQVCSGGIELSEINADFSLKRYPGLYATGEVLDVDGVCGGYNLFFAFASAWIVGQRINGGFQNL